MNLVPSRDLLPVNPSSCHSDVTQYQKNLVPEPTSGVPPLRKRGIKGDFSRPQDSSKSLSKNETKSGSFFDTLYLGGGTPSLLGAKKLKTLITGLNKSFSMLGSSPLAGEDSGEGVHPNRHCDSSEAISRSDRRPCLSPVESGFDTLSNSKRNDEIPSPLGETYHRPNQARQNQNDASPLSPCGRELERGVSPPKATPGLIEATIEVNPESATKEFLETAKNLGFNRISFGVQSLSDDELKSVGRIHTAVQGISAIQLAKKLGFKNISADLIIGLPGQTWATLRNSLQTLVGLGIQHLSVYCLSLEAGTPLAENPPPDLPSDDTQAELFEQMRLFLIASGFTHYEISNFALKGYECLHNLNYWRGGEYLGLGPAAASHLDGKRFKNNADFDAYLTDPTGQTEYVEELSAKEKAAEEAMLRLRLPEEGLNTDELASKFGEGNVKGIVNRLDAMVHEGLLISEGHRYRLTPSRILTSNPIFARVISNESGSGL